MLNKGHISKTTRYFAYIFIHLVSRRSKGKYRLKIWNSGQATAYHVDYDVPGDLRNIVMRDKVPYEILEAGKSFEEHIVYSMGTPSKLTVKTMWEDADGEQYEKEQIVSF